MRESYSKFNEIIFMEKNGKFPHEKFKLNFFKKFYQIYIKLNKLKSNLEE